MNFRREICAALREDRAFSDVTTRTFVPKVAWAVARVVTKQPGVLAGVDVAAEAFQQMSRKCRLRIRVRDGRPISAGQTVLQVKGPLAAILSAERTALNVLTHLSGIATLTRAFVRAAGKAGPMVMDTRKTFPGLRQMQRWAVKCGGGVNHRSDLAAAVLIKENHVVGFKNQRHIVAFVRRVRTLRSRGRSVEMECQNRSHVRWALEAGADILLLDNFPLSRLRGLIRWVRTECRRRNRRQPLLEVSGGITTAKLRKMARLKIDRVSIGRLTHSAPALDMSLEIDCVERLHA